MAGRSWRHVSFIEELSGGAAGHTSGTGHEAGASAISETILQGDGAAPGQAVGFLGENRWLMMSDVRKHCTHAGCLDACPTGAIIRNEFGDVYVQPDVCNGCRYSVPPSPFRVIDLNHADGRAWQCTLCYDRQKDGFTPACP